MFTAIHLAKAARGKQNWSHAPEFHWAIDLTGVANRCLFLRGVTMVTVAVTPYPGKSREPVSCSFMVVNGATPGNRTRLATLRGSHGSVCAAWSTALVSRQSVEQFCGLRGSLAPSLCRNWSPLRNATTALPGIPGVRLELSGKRSPHSRVTARKWGNIRER